MNGFINDIHVWENILQICKKSKKKECHSILTFLVRSCELAQFQNPFLLLLLLLPLRMNFLSCCFRPPPPPPPPPRHRPDAALVDAALCKLLKDLRFVLQTKRNDPDEEAMLMQVGAMLRQIRSLDPQWARNGSNLLPFLESALDLGCSANVFHVIKTFVVEEESAFQGKELFLQKLEEYACQTAFKDCRTDGLFPEANDETLWMKIWVLFQQERMPKGGVKKDWCADDIATDDFIRWLSIHKKSTMPRKVYNTMIEDWSEFIHEIIDLQLSRRHA